MTKEPILTSYLLLDTVHDDRYMLDPSEREPLRRAINDYLETGKDKLLSLECQDGFELDILVSAVYAFGLSTPESRQRRRELEEAANAESQDWR